MILSRHLPCSGELYADFPAIWIENTDTHGVAVVRSGTVFRDSRDPVLDQSPLPLAPKAGGEGPGSPKLFAIVVIVLAVQID